MEISSLPSIINNLKPTFLLPNLLSNRSLSSTFPSQNIPIFSQTHSSLLKTSSLSKNTVTHFSIPFKFSKAASFLENTSTPSLNSHKNQLLILKNEFLKQNKLNLHLSIGLIAAFSAQFPCYAVESTISTNQVSNRIDLESILVAIDDFLTRYPFFASGVAFIWLVAIPLTQAYFKKFKFVTAINAFKKLRDDPSSQLLDIRDKKSLSYLGSPSLKILNKKTVQVHFLEGEEDGFVKKVLENFKDPGNTTICILDSFDGNSFKVAELLFKNGFREAYAIKGGLRGKKGWQAIQETLLPPSVHVFPKNDKRSEQLKEEKEINVLTNNNGQPPSVPTNKSEGAEDESVNTKEPSSQATIHSSGSLSPYPNYPDLKPPSSPTPSKPQK